MYLDDNQSKMSVIECPPEGCTYATPDAASLLIIEQHSLSANAFYSKQKLLKIDILDIARDYNKEI